MSLWLLNFYYTEICHVIEHSLSSRCVLAGRKESFPRCKHSLTSLWLHLSSRRSCWLDKHCQKHFWEWSRWAQPPLISALFIYVFIKFVPKWGEGSPLFFFFSLPQIKSTLPTESLLHRYRRSLSCRLQFGMAMDVQQPNASPLGSFLRLEFRRRPCLPFTVSASSFFPSCISFSTALCHTHGPNSCYAIWPFLLSTVDNEHNLNLLAPAHTHRGKGLKVCTCSQ